MSSVNKVILIGNLGKDPEIRTTQAGKEIASLSIATSERWKDKSGEYQEKTEWHKVSVFSEPLAKMIKNYVKKGSSIYIEGQLETRKWVNKEGQDQYTTEVVVKGFSGSIQLLDAKPSAIKAGESANKSYDAKQVKAQVVDTSSFDDEIPF